MHVLGPGVVAGLMRALDLAEAEGRAFVIWSVDEPFSAGADLKAMLPVFMAGGAKAIEPEVARLQNAHQALKYANVPVVAAVAGLASGGRLKPARCTFLLNSNIPNGTIEQMLAYFTPGNAANLAFKLR